MTKKSTSTIHYEQIKKNQSGNSKKINGYEEKKHCAMVIEIMSDSTEATMQSFCVKAGISDKTFYTWLYKYPIFAECYQYGRMVSYKNWEDVGKNSMYDEDFNIEVWKMQGASRYGVGKTNRVRVHIDSETNPFDQYKQLMAQASNGDFTAAELKQLMEAINIGCKAYEVFEMQKEINRMKEDLKKMSNHNANNIRPIESAKKAN